MPKWQKWINDDYEEIEDYVVVERIKKKKKKLVEHEPSYEKKDNPQQKSYEKRY